MPDNRDAAVRYGQIKLQMSMLEAELEKITPDATAFIASVRGDTDQPVQLTEFQGFNYSIQGNKTWTYSPTVERFQKQLDDEKKKEKADGTATFVEKPTLYFRAPRSPKDNNG